MEEEITYFFMHPNPETFLEAYYSRYSFDGGYPPIIDSGTILGYIIVASIGWDSNRPDLDIFKRDKFTQELNNAIKLARKWTLEAIKKENESMDIYDDWLWQFLIDAFDWEKVRA